MSVLATIFVFILVWWVMLFTTLPIGVRKLDAPAHGHERGAPENPDLKKKIILTTALAAVVTFVIYLVAQSGMIDFRESSKNME